MIRGRQSRLLALLLAAGGLLPIAPAALGTPFDAPADPGAIIYLVHPGDTLIGIGRRLLVTGSAWRQVGALNHVIRERRLVPGSGLLIPIPLLRWSARDATVIALSGHVTADGKAVVAGQTLQEGALLETGLDGSIALRLHDGSEVSVPSATKLTLKSLREASGTDAPDIRLTLPSGQVEVSAAKHHDTGRFEITTPTAITAVRGTHYRSHFDAADAAATSETLSGVIAVEANGANQPVQAGFGTRVDPDRAPLAPVALLSAPDLSRLAPRNEARVLELPIGAVGGARRYRVQVSSREDFQSLELDSVVDQPLVKAVDLPDGTHWIRARAIDALGIEGLDSVRSFVQHTLPPPPASLSPVNESQESGAQLAFRWSAGTGTIAAGAGVETGAGHYRFELWPEGGGTPMVRRDLDTDHLDIERLPLGRYVWRVAALAASGEQGSWSEQRVLAQRPAPPAVQAARLQGKGRVEISWAPQPGYLAEIQLAHDAAFGSAARQASSADSSVRFAHLKPGLYFVRIRWATSDGYVGPYGAVRELRVPIPWWTWLVVGAAMTAVAL